jgi:photosystem II stability/assembly factor-like uncharacterized protein
VKPIRRRRRDSGVESALQTSLAAQARHAPSGDGLPERILAAVDAPPSEVLEPRRRRVSWALPALAAAAAVAAVAVGISVVDGSGHPALPAAQRSPGLDQQHRASPTTPLTVHPTVPSRPVPVGGLRQVRVRDLTFAGTDDGWALATADCPSGSGRCTVLLRTRDGVHWRRLSQVPFRYPAVAHLRFATDRVGYAFGPSAFYLTSDGGHTWQRAPGGAVALETLGGNVIRVTSPHTGCPGPCNVGVETAAVGSTSWLRTVAPGGLHPSNEVAGVQFARSSADAYLLVTANPAGGANRATSTLFRSTDAGRTWNSVGEPCPQTSGENDSVAVAAGADGVVSVLCERRLGAHHSQVVTSTDAGSSFRAQHGVVPFPYSSILAGDPNTVLIAAGIQGAARSTDGGASWQRIPQLPGGITFVGFENSQVGRVAAQHGRSVWTTRDGGRSWTPVNFP